MQRRSPLALATLALMLALPAGVQGQTREELAQVWSAEEMLDTEVRGPGGDDIGEVEDVIVGPDGQVQRLVVEAGGAIFGIGATHIGVPWRQVRIGPEMQYVQVPVTAENLPGYPVYDAGDAPLGHWRVRELIHDVARLEDEPFYGRIHDVLFDAAGNARWVVVDRRTGLWGVPGPYAHPFTGYRPGSAYDIPGRADALGPVPRFDYVRLGELSRFSRADEPAGAGTTR